MPAVRAGRHWLCHELAVGWIALAVAGWVCAPLTGASDLSAPSGKPVIPAAAQRLWPRMPLLLMALFQMVLPVQAAAGAPHLLGRRRR